MDGQIQVNNCFYSQQLNQVKNLHYIGDSLVQSILNAET